VTSVLAANGGEAALTFIELGAVAVVLALLAGLAARLGITAIPLYLLAGLVIGRGGLIELELSDDFIQLAGEIGVLLLLLSLGLEYTGDELRQGLRTGGPTAAVDAAANFVPGFVAGLLLGWSGEAAILLGGVCWVSSSGIVAKVLSDLDRLGNRETPAVLNLLVLEDLAMAVFLPVVGAMVVGGTLAETALAVAVAVAVVAVILMVALRWGHRLSRLLDPASDEALVLAVFGLTLLVGGLASESRCRRRSVRSSSAWRCRDRCRSGRECSSVRCATSSPRPFSCSSRMRSSPRRSPRSPSPPSCLRW
jgi:monovalent cation:H+ antiporter-2, CPA2 family